MLQWRLSPRSHPRNARCPPANIYVARDEDGTPQRHHLGDAAVKIFFSAKIPPIERAPFRVAHAPVDSGEKVGRGYADRDDAVGHRRPQEASPVPISS